MSTIAGHYSTLHNEHTGKDIKKRPRDDEIFSQENTNVFVYKLYNNKRNRIIADALGQAHAKCDL